MAWLHTTILKLAESGVVGCHGFSDINLATKEALRHWLELQFGGDFGFDLQMSHLLFYLEFHKHVQMFINLRTKNENKKHDRKISL